MEYEGPPEAEEESPFDMNKVNYINQMGQTWIGADCKSFPNPEQCIKLNSLSMTYGSEFMKIQRQLEKCSDFLEDDQNDVQANLSFNKCIESSEKALRYIIDAYYDQFKKCETAFK